MNDAGEVRPWPSPPATSPFASHCWCARTTPSGSRTTRGLPGTYGSACCEATTGEARLLQVAGLADENGVLAADTRIDTPRPARWSPTARTPM